MQLKPSYLLGLIELVGLAYVLNLGQLEMSRFCARWLPRRLKDHGKKDWEV